MSFVYFNPRESPRYKTPYGFVYCKPLNFEIGSRSTLRNLAKFVIYSRKHKVAETNWASVQKVHQGRLDFFLSHIVIFAQLRPWSSLVEPISQTLAERVDDM